MMRRLSLSLVALLGGAAAATAQTVDIKTPAVGSTYDYLWNDGQRDQVTILSTTGGRLRMLVETDFEDDGFTDDTTVQYYNLNSRLWLAMFSSTFVSLYTPDADTVLPEKIVEGMAFGGRFDHIETDGVGDFTGYQSSMHSSCDYNVLAEPVELELGKFDALEMSCIDTQINDQGELSLLAKDSYPYTETWSIDLGMPVLQTFGMNPETKEPDSWSTLVGYALD